MACTAKVKGLRPRRKSESARRGNEIKDTGKANKIFSRAVLELEPGEAGMEKIVTCTKCQRAFKVSGSLSRMKEVPQGVTCPFCGESNEVMWPMDTGFETIPKTQSS
jgi:DNA-directed RNA polymerase subunit M/transcription elongation factor TFIIS